MARLPDEALGDAARLRLATFLRAAANLLEAGKPIPDAQYFFGMVDDVFHLSIEWHGPTAAALFAGEDWRGGGSL